MTDEIRNILTGGTGTYSRFPDWQVPTRQAMNILAFLRRKYVDPQTTEEANEAGASMQDAVDYLAKRLERGNTACPNADWHEYSKRCKTCGELCMEP